jgi:hypothetical protein
MSVRIRDKSAGITSGISFPDASKEQHVIRLLLKRPYPGVLLFAVFIPIFMWCLLFLKTEGG